jgi:ABC-type uncharacterized transport system substrate-binding protein
MRRRNFLAFVGGAATWPLVARAQQRTLPVVGFVSGLAPEPSARNAAAFRTGVSESGYVEGQNVTVEYHWLEGHYDLLPSLMADLVRRHVAVIATPGSTPAALAAKSATSEIPIIFGASEDPVKLGLVGSISQPGGNATGINWFASEVISKRFDLLHELVPTARRIGILLNPLNASTSEPTLKELERAARNSPLEIQVFNATKSSEIDAAFTGFEREHIEALFVGPDGLFYSRRVQLAMLAARYWLPASYPSREIVEIGGLMSYGASLSDMYWQVGVYCGRILKGEKPAQLPVLQSTKFEFVINLQTAKILGLDVSPTLLARADEVIE